MDVYKISDAAAASGFSESALRFYEREGIVVPARTASGYRVYRDEDLEALRFVGRAKGLGLRLAEIADLLALLRADECEPVQARMRHLVTSRIVDVQQRAAELAAFIDRLSEVADRMAANTPDGPCDDRCGCRSEIDPVIMPSRGRR